MVNGDSLKDPNFAPTLWRWRWLGGYIVIAWALAWQIPSYVAIAPSQSLGQEPLNWVLSPQISVDIDDGRLHWASERPGRHWASTALTVSQLAEFLRVRFCLADDVPPTTAAVLLASVRNGSLDFNRQSRVSGFYGGTADDCFDDPIPRRAGDGPAVLQIQLLNAPASLSLSSLEIQPLKENPVWRGARMAMLSLGLLLLLLLLKEYRHTRPTLLVLAGLLTVVGILFGCCVSVSLKADIYALMTGGRSVDVQTNMLALLQTRFPLGGFSLFTMLHAVLFFGATFCLAMARRYAWVDMLMLAPLTETMQIFVPGRGPGTRDMLVDWGGVIAALLLVFLFRRSQRIRAFLQY